MTIGSNASFSFTHNIFFSWKIFDLEKKREKKRQIIKKRQIKKNQKITSKTTNISIIHLQNRMIPINNHSLIIESKNRLHRQCEAYDDYQSKYIIFIHLYHTFSVKKWKNKKFIRWKTTNILIVHLQNQSIPIKYNQSLYQSKNRLHRQCEAYDDYRSKYPIYHSLLSFFSVENFWLRKKREKKRQIIKKRQIKKIKK